MSKAHIITERYTLMQGDCLEKLRTIKERASGQLSLFDGGEGGQ